MKIKTVIFDLDDTLIGDDSNVRRALRVTCDPVANRHGIDCDKFVSTLLSTARDIWYASPTHEYCQRVGIGSWEGLWIEYVGDNSDIENLRRWTPTYRREAWNQTLMKFDIRDTVLADELNAKFPDERRKIHDPFPEVAVVLDELRTDYRLALLTNGAVSLQNEKLDLSGLRPCFDVVTVSGEIGIGKPDRQVFDLTLERLGLPADAAVMVGDNLRADIAGALGVGMRAVWINRYDKPNDAGVVPDFEINCLDQLPSVLESLAK